jgi:hypothetical protein
MEATSLTDLLCMVSEQQGVPLFATKFRLNGDVEDTHIRTKDEEIKCSVIFKSLWLRNCCKLVHYCKNTIEMRS